jgi:pimeloyl-[acyl-carrier protein] synthase
MQRPAFCKICSATEVTATMDAEGPLSAEAIRDPFTYYDRLRENTPVYWDASVPAWFVSRYEDVESVIASPDTYSNATFVPGTPPSPPILPEQAPQYEFVRESLSQQLIRFDPPKHTPMRKAIHRHFTPPKAELVRDVVRRLVDERLTAAAAAGQMDVVTDLALPLPLAVIAELLGIPQADRARIGELNDGLLRLRDQAPDRMTQVSACIQELNEYFGNLADERQRDPKPDLMMVLLEAEQAGVLTREQVIADAVFLVDAGHSTTISMISNGLLTFIRHPDQWQLLLSDPARYVKTAVEEVLRYEPPLKNFDRLLVKDATLHGETMRAGQRVRYAIAAANRDPRKFPDPTSFDITRTPNPHLAFGTGVHHCLGVHLARLEAQEVFSAVAARFPTLRLVGADSEIEYRPSLSVRQVKRLVVTW